MWVRGWWELFPHFWMVNPVNVCLTCGKVMAIGIGRMESDTCPWCCLMEAQKNMCWQIPRAAGGTKARTRTGIPFIHNPPFLENPPEFWKQPHPESVNLIFLYSKGWINKHISFPPLFFCLLKVGLERKCFLPWPESSDVTPLEGPWVPKFQAFLLRLFQVPLAIATRSIAQVGMT